MNYFHQNKICSSIINFQLKRKKQFNYRWIFSKHQKSEKNHISKNDTNRYISHFVFIFHRLEEKKSFSTVQQVVTHDDYSHTCQDWRHWSHDMCDSWEHACRSLTMMTTGPWLLCRGTSVNMEFIIGKRYSERKMAIATVCTRAFGANGGNHPKFTLHIQFRSLVRAGLRVYCMHYDFITQEGEESFLWCVHSTRSETLCGYFSLLEINFSTFCLENEKLFISFRYSTFLNK